MQDLLNIVAREVRRIQEELHTEHQESRDRLYKMNNTLGRKVGAQKKEIKRLREAVTEALEYLDSLKCGEVALECDVIQLCVKLGNALAGVDPIEIVIG